MTPVLQTIPKTLHITSPAFDDGGELPEAFTVDNEFGGHSPPIAIGNVPPENEFVALVMEQVGAAPRRIQWLFWNLPEQQLEVPEAAEVTMYGAVEGANSEGHMDYQPPGAPAGYSIRVYSLDKPLTVAPGAGVAELEAQLSLNAVAWGEITAHLTQ